MLQNEYDAIFERAALVADERLHARLEEIETAKSLLPDLWKQLSVDREGALAESRYHTLEVVRLLVARSFELSPEPTEAAKTAAMATAIADRLETSRYGFGVVEEARTRAWSSLGNSLRAVGNLRSAAVAFRIAAGHLVSAGGDPILQAELLSFIASLRDSEGRPAQALPLIDRVRTIYQEAGDRRLEARALITKGMLLASTGRFRKAHSWTHRGISLTPMGDDPALHLGAQHNLLYFLAMSGSPRKALNLLAEKRGLYIELGNRSLLLKLRWLDGTLARQLGDLSAAESFFLLVRDGLLEQGLELDAALAVLEIAKGYMMEGRRSCVKSLTAEVIPILESYGALQQAEAARHLFQWSAD
jgi:tetratricopeptide (TPR) repeat protein